MEQAGREGEDGEAEAGGEDEEVEDITVTMVIEGEEIHNPRVEEHE